MKARQRRLLLLGAVAGGAAIAVALVLNAFRSNLVFFFSPTQVVDRQAPAAHTFRLGGLVVAGSLKRRGTDVEFGVTDSAHTVTVQYSGLLPDLFKEGKGVVAQGKLGGNGVFLASEILAKHDENYMPPEAAEALTRAQASRAAAIDTPQARP